MSEVAAILEANARYAGGFRNGDLLAPPRRRLAILTCMDARIDPAKAFELEEGDAHVVRNAGGRASDDAIRSLVISTHLLGTREILVIHHTDCGMHAVTNEDVRERLRRNLGVDASQVDFLPLSDLDQSLQQDVATIRSTPLLPPDILVHGFVFDVRTGRLRDVC